MIDDRRNEEGTLISYSSLLFAILTLIIISPHIHQLAGSILVELLFTCILLLSISIVSNNAKVLLIGIALISPALILSWMSIIEETVWMRIFSKGLYALFILYTTIILSKRVFFSKKVHPNLIHGALCIYLLTGVLWAIVYTLINTLNPAAFYFPDHMLAAHESDSFKGMFEYFLYYSYVTLTTLGFGEITPVSALTRSLSALEAITGQFYIATLVASLVARIMRQNIQSQDIT